MVDACQIPESILQNISTNDLMTLCLRHPLLFDVFAFNDMNDGLKKLFADFNERISYEKNCFYIDTKFCVLAFFFRAGNV